MATIPNSDFQSLNPYPNPFDTNQFYEEAPKAFEYLKPAEPSKPLPHNVLQKITFPSIYKVNGSRVPVPSRMAWCTPDTYHALFSIQEYLETEYPKSKLILSDLYRSYDMQLQAHLDYATGKKKSYSPPPGGSMHECGRAFDLSLEDLLKDSMTLGEFWSIAKIHGVVPIISRPVSTSKEAWHFECRGSHQKVYDYYQSLTTRTNMSPYEAMVTSALLDSGHYSSTRLNLRTETAISVAVLQSSLIRLGFDPGVIDGLEGPRTKEAVRQLMRTHGRVYTFTYETRNLSEYRHVSFSTLQSSFNAEYFHKGLTAFLV